MPNGISEIKLISHSNVFYWWPAWVVGYLLALLSFLEGRSIVSDQGNIAYVHPSNTPGVFFVGLLILLIVFTNARLRGMYSVVTALAIAFVVVLFAWLGWWDDIVKWLPQLSARANMGFYLVFSTALLAVWAVSFFVVDRVTYWRVRPGQLLEERLVRASSQSYDTNGLVFEKREQDFFRHTLLGLGAGDLRLRTNDRTRAVIDIPNVLFVDRKANAIERLITVKPEQIPVEPRAA